jgi:hypothetical protein
VRGCPPQTPPVGQGRTPGTRHGCAGGGGGGEVEGGGWRVEDGGGWRVFIILHSVALQSLEDVVDERLLGGDGSL